MSYRCTVLPDGTGTASEYFAPMFEEWSGRSGIKLEEGTLNLCCEIEPELLPSEYERLDPSLAPRRGATLSPRLYPVTLVTLNGSRRAWLYRWSEPEHLSEWVDDEDGCPRRCRLEIVAEVHLKTEYELKRGDLISVEVDEQIAEAQRLSREWIETHPPDGG